MGVIVCVHEFGHFFFAKLFGIYVYESAIGMGPQIFKWKGKNGETTYSLRAIPIGGFCSLAGEGNDEDKKIYYVNPTLDIGYSINPDAKVEEPYNDNTRLNVIQNVPYNQLFKIKQDIRQRCNVIPSFYNTDFAISIYINSEIRNRMKYEEGNNNPRIVVMDFETEKEAIRVKPINKTINAKCRLASLFDILTKTFYCAVLKDPNHHTDEVIDII